MTTRSAPRSARFALLFLITLTASVAAHEVEPFASHECPYIRCAVEHISRNDYDVLPIRLSGKTLSYYDAKTNANIRRLYFPVMKRFPNLESCVSNSDPATQLLVKVKLRWQEFGSQAAASVCIFRLFDAMRDTAIAAIWLEENGFLDVRDLPGEQEASYSYYDEAHAPKDVRVVSAYWSTEKNGRLFRPFLGSQLDRIVSRGSILNAVFDSGGNVLSIRIASKPRFPL